MNRLAIVLTLVVAAAFSAPVSAGSVQLHMEGGIYYVPIVINDRITLNFLVDSGASDVSIPADVFSTLVRTGTITRHDFIDKGLYELADGSTHTSQRFHIKSLRVGQFELHEVVAVVAPAAGSLLLGQSFLSRLKSWSIDNQAHMLVFNEADPAVGVPTGRDNPAVGVPTVRDNGQAAAEFPVSDTELWNHAKSMSTFTGWQETVRYLRGAIAAHRIIRFVDSPKAELDSESNPVSFLPYSYAQHLESAQQWWRENADSDNTFSIAILNTTDTEIRGIQFIVHDSDCRSPYQTQQIFVVQLGSELMPNTLNAYKFALPTNARWFRCLIISGAW
jgi:clan AA aspartic protease (TIGR02281 family)